MNNIKSFFKNLNFMDMHIVKRDNLEWYWRILIRAIAIILAFLFCAVIVAAVYNYHIGDFIKSIWNGVFGTERRRWIFLFELAILLGFSIAVVPAFKMKFWNCGADGQALMGALVCAGCMHYMGGSAPDAVIIIVSLILSLIAGIIWAVIPAIFKAFFNTNETLFTLMMNYIAIQFVLFFIKTWVTGGVGKLMPMDYGNLPSLGNKFLLPILIIVAVTAIVAVYLKYTKHGYELSLVGESENSAKYAGINVKWVIIRTMIVSGAIAGLVGFLLVAGYDHTVSDATTNSRGFTAIIVTWMAGMNPLYMILTSFFVVFVSRGTSQLITDLKITSSAFQDIIIGIFYFFVIGCEFFVRYKIMFGKKQKDEDKNPVLEKPEPVLEASLEMPLEPKAEEVQEEVIKEETIEVASLSADAKEEVQEEESSKEEKEAE